MVTDVVWCFNIWGVMLSVIVGCWYELDVVFSVPYVVIVKHFVKYYCFNNSTGSQHCIYTVAIYYLKCAIWEGKRFDSCKKAAWI